jgi:segregation and condensation protein B
MDLKFVVESILFTSQKPLSLREIRDVLVNAADKAEEEPVKAYKKIKDEELQQALASLEQEHANSARSYYLACVAGAWQFVTRPEFMPWLKTLFGVKTRPPRLSQPALETLAIIAYRQPITRAEIEQIRGVAVDGVVATLLERGLLENAGRAEVIGRPMMYATTPLFLEYFGLRNLDELPAADELRRIPVEKPEALATTEGTPGENSDQSQAEAAGSPAETPTTPVVEIGTDTQSSSQSPTTEDASRTGNNLPAQD